MNLDAQYITTVAFNFSRFPILKKLYYDGINTRKTIIGLSIVREKNQIGLMKLRKCTGYCRVLF